MATDREEYTGGALVAWRYLLGAERLRQIVPGAAREVMTMVGNDPRAGGDVLGFVHASVFGRRNALTGNHEPGIHARFLNPEHEAAPEMPVRSVVNRLVSGGHIKKEAAEGMVSALAARTAGLDGDLLIARLEQHVEERANWPSLVDEPPRPYGEQRLLKAINHHRDQLSYDPGVIDRIVHEFRDLPAAGISDGMLNLKVAERLAMPHRSEYWRHAEFKYQGSDEIYHPRYIEPESRQAHEAEHAAQMGRRGEL